ncbi:MAG: GTP-binding protein [Gloeocapsa sp. DLM2.Bin57]|nr:MAG: GTP-binding protein [Gloeocapsa sp. DLM2.Bin57]
MIRKDSQSYLVLIGRNLNVAEINQGLEECLLS